MGRSSRHQTIPEESTSSAAASPRPSKHQYRKQVRVRPHTPLLNTFAQISESGLISPTATPPLSKQLLRSKSIASSKDTLLIRFDSNLNINETKIITKKTKQNQTPGKTARLCPAGSQLDQAVRHQASRSLGFTAT